MASPTFLSYSLRHRHTQRKKEKKVKAEADEDYWQDLNSLAAATGAESVAHKRSKWLVRPDQLCLRSFTIRIFFFRLEVRWLVAPSWGAAEDFVVDLFQACPMLPLTADPAGMDRGHSSSDHPSGIHHVIGNCSTEPGRTRAEGRSWVGQGLRQAANRIREPLKLRPIQQRQGVEQLEDGQVEDRRD
jgi:hypothetical protein